MPTRSLRLAGQCRSNYFAVLAVIAAAALLLLAGCGSGSRNICPVSASGNASSAACPCYPACQLPEYIYANGVDGKVYGFPVVNGAAQSPTSGTVGAASSVGMTSLNSYLYISNPSLTVGGASSIEAWSANLSNGELTTVPGSPFSLGPSTVATQLAADTLTSTLYVADASQIDALQINPMSGVLTPVTGSPYPGGTNLHFAIDPLNRFLYASDDSATGDILAYTIDASTGALTAVPGSPFPIIPGSSSGQPEEITVDPTGNFVYVALRTSGQVAGFSIASSTGALTPLPGSPYAAGNGPVSLAAASTFLYVSNLGDGTLSGYKIDPTTGVLTALATSPFAIPAGVFTVPSFGGYVYTAGQGGLMTFVIDLDGQLTQVGQTQSFAGATALTFVF